MQLLNEGTFPEYFIKGRLVPLSKKNGHAEVGVDDIAIRVALTYFASQIFLKWLQRRTQHSNKPFERD
jgi:hypothetical protein